MSRWRGLVILSTLERWIRLSSLTRQLEHIFIRVRCAHVNIHNRPAEGCGLGRAPFWWALVHLKGKYL